MDYLQTHVRRFQRNKIKVQKCHAYETRAQPNTTMYKSEDHWGHIYQKLTFSLQTQNFKQKSKRQIQRKQNASLRPSQVLTRSRLKTRENEKPFGKRAPSLVGNSICVECYHPNHPSHHLIMILEPPRNISRTAIAKYREGASTNSLLPRPTEET